MRKYAAFILSHGRPDAQITLKSLRKSKYAGDWYIVCDDEDETLDEYKRRYDDKVIVFSKDDIKVDMMDNYNERRAVVYARNALFDIAKRLGLTHFIELDDDYTEFAFRIPGLGGHSMKDINPAIEATFDLLDGTGAMVVAWGQGGEYIGGDEGGVLRAGFKRKAMNTFFFHVDSPMRFMGTINEDVNSYVYYGHRGGLIFMVTCCMIMQVQTQVQKGGLTDAYKRVGTYVKSFYPVMIAPSCVRISTVGMSYYRIHHHIDWEYCVPKIISDKYKVKRYAEKAD